LKQCNRCKIEKELSDFSIDNSKKDGRRTICRNCDKDKFTTEKYRSEARIRKRTERLAFPEIQMLYLAKTRAKRKNLPFDISVSDIVIPEVCPILGIKLKTNVKTVGYDSPSLDRIVPELGYVKNNIQVVSHLANTMKNSATIEQLITFSKSILRMFKVDDPS
jgi:hypothetical protein